ncbi:MAG: hypothetical protein ACTSVU_03205 [Promethearchaeota archaeon]
MTHKIFKKWTIIASSIVVVSLIGFFAIAAIDPTFLSQVFPNLHESVNNVIMRINSFMSNFSLLDKELGGPGGTP